MILSDRDIVEYMRIGDLIIDPFSRESLQPSGYDLRFGGEYIMDDRRYKKDFIEIPPVHYIKGLIFIHDTILFIHIKVFCISFE